MVAGYYVGEHLFICVAEVRRAVCVVYCRGNVKIFHTNIETNIHDPLTDSLNLMHLYDSFLTKQSILKEQYINVLRRSPALPNPFRKILKKLESEQKVSYKDFITYVEEDLK